MGPPISILRQYKDDLVPGLIAIGHYSQQCLDMDNNNPQNEVHSFMYFALSSTSAEKKTGLRKQRKAIQNLRKRISHLDTPHKNKQIAYMNLLAYVDRQVYMQEQFVDQPVECTAWVARNLYEVNLLAQYLGGDEQRATVFINDELNRDELQILKGFTGLNLKKPPKELEAHLKNVELRMRQLTESLRESGASEKGYRQPERWLTLLVVEMNTTFISIFIRNTFIHHLGLLMPRKKKLMAIISGLCFLLKL